MDQNDQLQESDFLKLVEKCQELIDQYPKDQNNNIDTVLLVGITGCGKSTIFNFLSGANFTISGNQMEITNNSDRFSKMNEGMKSVTKQPNFYKNNQNNHIIIDFPGFQDTDGAKDQLLIDLLFNKIVTSGPIKLIYVVDNPQNKLQNRGQDIISFMKQLKNPKFDLLLNSYMEELSDEDLIQLIKKGLAEEKLIGNIGQILVLRGARMKSLDQIFNDNKRITLWSQIQQINKYKIQPKQLPQSEKISLYITESSLQIINNYLVLIYENFDQKYKNLSKNTAEDILKNMQELLDFVKKENNETPLQWYLTFITICEKIAQNLEINHDIINSSKNFIKILKYFEQFSNVISGYQNINTINSNAKNQVKQIEELINTRKECLKKSQIDSKIVEQLMEVQKDFKKTVEQLYNEKYELLKEKEKMKRKHFKQERKINMLNEECNKNKLAGQDVKQLEEKLKEAEKKLNEVKIGEDKINNKEQNITNKQKEADKNLQEATMKTEQVENQQKIEAEKQDQILKKQTEVEKTKNSQQQSNFRWYNPFSWWS